MKRSMLCLLAAFAIVAATSCGYNNSADGTRNADISSVTGGDAGTKGTGSAGLAPGGDAGTKGTGSTGVTSDSTLNNNNK